MLRTVKRPTAWDDYAKPVPVELGGFGSTTKEGAQIALGAIPGSMIGKPGGPLPLDEDGLVDSKYLGGVISRDISILGDDYVQPGETKEWILTTYDAFTDYKITPILGKVSRDGAVITYMAGDILGEGGFVINGRPVKISIGGGSVLAPTIMVPTKEGMTSPTLLTIVTTDFSVVGTDTHLSTDWELAFDPEFNLIKASSYDDVTNLTTWSLENMDWNTRYYVRARHRGVLKGAGDWSPTANFMTNSLWGIVGKINSSDAVADDGFSCAVLNAAGDMALIGSFKNDNVLTDAGAVYYFTRSGNVWTQIQKFHASDAALYSNFGTTIALSPDGLHALISATVDDTKGNDAGAVYYFTRTGSVWTQQQKFYSSDIAEGDYFGGGISLNAAGDYALIGAHADDDTALNSGSVYVFTRTGNVWTQQQKFHAANPLAGAWFGTGIALNSNATYAFIGSPNDINNSGVLAGCVYIFTRTGNTWTQQQKIIASDGIAGCQFGLSSAFSESANIAFIGARKDSTKGTNAGAVYVFTRTGNVWTQQQKIVAPDGAAGDYFGNTLTINAAGTYALIGSTYDDDKGQDSGSVYIYTLASKDYPKEYFYKITAADAAASNYFGISCALNAAGDFALIGANGRGDKGANSGSVYVFVKSGNIWTQQQKLLASDGAEGDYFGYSCALNAAGDLALIGAHQNDDKGINAGTIYVFIRIGNVWTQQQKLYSSDIAAIDYFGISCALNAAGDLALIGARNDDDTAADSGSVYVFTRSGTVWTQQQKLIASDGAAIDYFGRSCALSPAGDLALIGAIGDGDKGEKSGSVYVFIRNGTTWTQQQKLTAYDGETIDEFGTSVALNAAGDIAFIGSRYDDDKAKDTGSVYIFVRNGSSWTYVDKILPSDGMEDDGFGASCCVSSDGTMALIGANRSDGAFTDQGAVYFYRLPPFIWPNAEKGKIYAADAAANDQFGVSCALNATGDLALVGAHTDDDKASDAGSVYVFTRSGTVWTQQQKLTASDGVASDFFGRAVALNSAGDLALIGANNVRVNGIIKGSVYVFTRSGNVWTQQQKLLASDGVSQDYFGQSCALNGAGDLALIGAHGSNAKVYDAGCVYVFTRLGSVWTQQQKLIASDGAASDYFGMSCALNFEGDLALIGAASSDTVASDAGCVYVFTRSEMTWTQQQKLTASDGVTNDRFGFSCALNAAGDLALIGTILDGSKASRAGAVYVFTRSGTTWTQQQKLIASDGAEGDQFGISCALNAAGDLALIGAYLDDNKGADSGSVYVFA